MTVPETNDLDVADMHRLVAGDDLALKDIMDRHAPKLFGYLYRCVQDEDDAADLAQETFARVYTHRANYDPRQQFATWLYVIAANLVKDHYRWRRRHPQVSLEARQDTTDAEPAPAFTHPAPTPDQQLQADERAQAVQRAVAELPEELRQPLILAEYDFRPHSEIAAILGCTRKAVETRIYRARQRLRSRLARWLQPA
jgi:RNA polymerase sigma-70 factor (ECF subfamily)